MPKRTGIVPREVLTSAPLPEHTETYTVIPHEFVINTAIAALEEKGLKVTKEIFKCTARAQVASGIFHIQDETDKDMSMMFAFVNSYNKQVRFKCAVGSYVRVNEASLMSDNMDIWNRVHKGNADSETEEAIKQQIDNAGTYFQQLVADKEYMKRVTITDTDFAELVGVLFMELKLLSSEQMNIIKNEFYKPSFAYDTPKNSLWTLYNHILLALMKCHPKAWMDQQKLVHLHLTAKYNMPDSSLAQSENVGSQLPEAAQSEPSPEVEEQKPTPILPGFTPTGPAKVVETAEDGSPLTSVTPGILNLSDKPVTIEEAFNPQPKGPNVVINKVSAEEAGKVLHDIVEKNVEEELHKNVVEAGTGPDDFLPDPEAARAFLENADTVITIHNPESPVTKAEDTFQEIVEDEAAVKAAEEPTIDISDLAGEYSTEEVGEVLDVMQERVDEARDHTGEELFIAHDDFKSIYPNNDVGDTIEMNDEGYHVLRTGDLNGQAGFFLVNEDDMTDKINCPVCTGEEYPEIIERDGKCMTCTAEDQQEGVQALVNAPEISAEEAAEAMKEAPIMVGSVNETTIEPIDAPRDGAGELTEFTLTDEIAKEPTPLQQEMTEMFEPIQEEAEAKFTEPEEEKKDDDDLRAVISSELSDLYGSLQVFTYERKDDQYNVKLETGEVIILLADEIDSRVGEMQAKRQMENA